MVVCVRAGLSHGRPVNGVVNAVRARTPAPCGKQAEQLVVVARDRFLTNTTLFVAEYTARTGTAVNSVGYAAGIVDTCPFDSSKRGPGACGCGVPDTDSDGDGVADCVDPEPHGQAQGDRQTQELHRLGWFWPVAALAVILLVAACCLFVMWCGNRKRDVVQPLPPKRQRGAKPAPPGQAPQHEVRVPVAPRGARNVRVIPGVGGPAHGVGAPTGYNGVPHRGGDNLAAHVPVPSSTSAW